MSIGQQARTPVVIFIFVGAGDALPMCWGLPLPLLSSRGRLSFTTAYIRIIASTSDSLPRQPERALINVSSSRPDEASTKLRRADVATEYYMNDLFIFPSCRQYRDSMRSLLVHIWLREATPQKRPLPLRQSATEKAEGREGDTRRASTAV